MLRTVKNEYPDFPAALSFLALISSEAALGQFTARELALGREVAALRSQAVDLRDRFQLPRLFSIEDEYRLAMLEAELRWVTGVVDDLRSGDFVLGPGDRDRLGRGPAEKLGDVPRHPARFAARQDLPP